MVAGLKEELREALEREKRARYLALHDELTRLPNRRYFMARLEAALRGDGVSSPELAVIYLDLDGFKALNDLHGHDIGDRVLKLVAKRFERAVRAEDFVSRLGGDEYACLILGAPGRRSVELIGSSLTQALSTPLAVGELQLSVRPSIGVAVYPSDGFTAESLMKSADAAMYMHKRAGYGALTRVRNGSVSSAG